MYSTIFSLLNAHWGWQRKELHVTEEKATNFEHYFSHLNCIRVELLRNRIVKYTTNHLHISLSSICREEYFTKLGTKQGQFHSKNYSRDT